MDISLRSVVPFMLVFISVPVLAPIISAIVVTYNSKKDGGSGDIVDSKSNK